MHDRLVIERHLAAPIDDVFDAWTDPARMVDWFMAGPDWTADVAANPTPGGSFNVVMHTPDNASMESHGEYVEVEPPNRLVFTWNSYAVSGTRVTVELRPTADGTHLTLIHEGLGSAEAVDRHAGGWGKMLTNLEAQYA